MSDQISANRTLAARWQKGKANTLHLYKKKLAPKARAFNRRFSLPDYFGTMIGKKKAVKIAELGAGMFCTIGCLWPGTKVTVYPSDILADEFNRILDKNKIIPVIPVVKEDMTDLSYPNNFFDIVHCRNALDHCLDPLQALQEMYRVCRAGGWLYLYHVINVGEHEKYRGLHQWNLEITSEKDLRIWNHQHEFLLNRWLPGFDHRLTRNRHGKLRIISILHKKA